MKPYFSQYGLQGQLLSSLFSYLKIDINLFFLLTRALFALLSAIAIAIFVFGIKREFGYFVAYICLFFLSISTWIIYYAKNLYWSTFLLFLPFSFSWFFYPKFQQKNKMFLFYLFSGGLLLFKSLTGYEFLSNVILSGYAPIFYFQLKNREKIKSVLTSFLYYSITGLIMFIVALSLHVGKIKPFFDNNAQAITSIAEKAAIRTYNNPAGLTDQFIEHLSTDNKSLYTLLDKTFNVKKYNNTPMESKMNFIWVMTQFLFSPVLSWGIIRQPLNGILGSWMLVVIISGYILIRWFLSNYYQSSNQIKALFMVTIFAFLACNNWFILAYGHSLNHPHIDSIVFYLPFLPLIYIVFSLSIVNFIQSHFKLKREIK